MRTEWWKNVCIVQVNVLITDGKPWKYVPSLSLEDNGQDGRSRGRDQMLSLMESCRTVITDSSVRP